jgi:hypothetical protein
MANPTWGELQKAQDNPETIEEAIARIVGEHNDDETAHLGEGRSLNSHAASEIIDHLADSIIEDKIALRAISLNKLLSFNRERYSLALESLDGWDISSGVVLNCGEIFAQTGNVSNTTRTGITRAGPLAKWNKDLIFQCLFQLSATTNQLVYVVCGSIDENDPEDQNVGFKISNGTLYALHSKTDGEAKTEYTTEITGITLTALNIYRVELDQGSEIRFYVNDVLKATHNSNLPDSGYQGGGICDFHIKNTAAENKTIAIRQVYFEQER